MQVKLALESISLTTIGFGQHVYRRWDPDNDLGRIGTGQQGS